MNFISAYELELFLRLTLAALCGLTTAAALWAAALGVVFGQGYYTIGILSTILIVIITSLLRFVHPEQWRSQKGT